MHRNSTDGNMQRSQCSIWHLMMLTTAGVVQIDGALSFAGHDVEILATEVTRALDLTTGDDVRVIIVATYMRLTVVSDLASQLFRVDIHASAQKPSRWSSGVWGPSSVLSHYLVLPLHFVCEAEVTPLEQAPLAAPAYTFAVILNHIKSLNGRVTYLGQYAKAASALSYTYEIVTTGKIGNMLI
ncbi:hypothetical protein M405DRAFT_879269 [Rhizopogon salebrosus TDB-379]|nr:hypothetical protein M405DRAFT_879269 [Rhizopogon salebrosus TDB-379]